VREGTGDEPLVEEAVDEHAQARQTIEKILAMDEADPTFDDTVKLLGELIDAHVLEEREKMFLEARQSQVDLKSLAVALFERKQQLKSGKPAPTPASKKVPA